MTIQSTVTQQAVEEFLGDVTLLVEHIGSAEGLAALSGVAGATRFQRVTDLPSLRQFLLDYQSQVLIPLELPTICRAFAHASRYEVRELIALDQQLATEPLLREFGAASQRVGKTQLKRLRPLRDQRLVQRYLRAVEAGEAHAWHTLVYGLVLSLYSFPPRQGLLSYAQQTTRGFIDSIAGRLQLTEADCRDLLNEVCARVPEAINSTMATVFDSKLLSA